MNVWNATSRIRWISFFTISLLIIALLSSTMPSPSPARASSSAACAGSDQASNAIVAFDPTDTNWNDSGSQQWSWAPSAANGFSSPTPGWGNPTDMRIRNNCVFGGTYMAITASDGLAAIIPYPAGNSRQWSLNVGGNPQAAELLPNGNIAIAATSGGWVRIYTSSQGASSTNYVQYDLPGAKGVLWDPLHNVLWAVGQHHLVALLENGSASAPNLEESFKIALPTAVGRDVQPVYGDTDRLWVSTDSAVYQYVKSTKTFDTSYTGSASISRAGVRSVGSNEDGQVVETVPKAGCQNAWCTDTADFFEPAATRTRTGASFYKVRYLIPEYQ
ncbi:DUF6528 family protein [Paenibacillus sp. J5C_2022]|uniref:DUF6528 family protein n=1 Tax=Paenibacillus sp. J5C2022 TaxID=2977129 RepID=UPI0021D15E54|nr:DUF6528 family protein [Paenibacillus sp. J5C2022]MCU6711871.1 DUF6528 family protein [Paenibacillus sp. J5C2022]